MSNPPPGARARRKAETRLEISNVATALFVARGFEPVSVAEIAEAAGVARKTVFNYFPRKEDLVFDREAEGRALVAAALTDRGARPPVQAFQALMRALVAADHPLFRMSERPVAFWRMVAASPALSARARELQVTLADDLAALLAAAAGHAAPDAPARLGAAMLVAALVVAYQEALAAFRDGRDPTAALLSVLDRGFTGVDAALAGTGYV